MAKRKKQYAADVMKLILGAGIGYTICSTFPRIPDSQGWVTFPSQTVGMFIGAVILALLSKKDRHLNVFFNKATFKNIFEGFNSSLGTFFYLTAMMLSSVSTAFTLSQMTPVISTFCGLTILHERKRGKTLAYTFSGVAVIVVGGVMTSFLR
ncbi:MAG: ribose uptake protein RbsU [Acetilactobacillus jinshanensis]